LEVDSADPVFTAADPNGHCGTQTIPGSAAEGHPPRTAMVYTAWFSLGAFSARGHRVFSWFSGQHTFEILFQGDVGSAARKRCVQRVYPSLFHPVDRWKEVNPALFQFKSFLLRPCVIGLIFNELGRLPENLAGQ
jgi:hypothetical protein